MVGAGVDGTYENGSSSSDLDPDFRFNTSFTGFIDTAEGPIVGSVILWGASVSPYTEYVTGGSTAAPIFKTIVSYLLPGD